MTPSLVIDSIERLLDSMIALPVDDRLYTYATIKVLVNELEEYADDHAADPGYTSEKFANLLGPVSSIAKIDDGNGHSDSQHLSWALTALDALRSVHCFNVKP